VAIADDLAEAGVPLARAHEVLAGPDAPPPSRMPGAGSVHGTGSAGPHNVSSAGRDGTGSAGREAEVPVS
jgi:hypothetical protein